MATLSISPNMDGLYNSMQRLAGRVAIITGAAGGVGRAIAEAMADQGAVVIVADSDKDELQKKALVLLYPKGL